MRSQKLYFAILFILSALPIAAIFLFLQGDITQVGNSAIMVGIVCIAATIIASIIFAIVAAPKADNKPKGGVFEDLLSLAKMSLPTVDQPFIETKISGVITRVNFPPAAIGLGGGSNKEAAMLNLKAPVNFQASIAGLDAEKVQNIEAKWRGWISRFGGTVDKDTQWMTWVFDGSIKALPSREQINHLLDCF